MRSSNGDSASISGPNELNANQLKLSVTQPGKLYIYFDSFRLPKGKPCAKNPAQTTSYGWIVGGYIEAIDPIRISGFEQQQSLWLSAYRCERWQLPNRSAALYRCRFFVGSDFQTSPLHFAHDIKCCKLCQRLS